MAPGPAWLGETMGALKSGLHAITQRHMEHTLHIRGVALLTTVGSQKQAHVRSITRTRSRTFPRIRLRIVFRECVKMADVGGGSSHPGGSLGDINCIMVIDG